MLSHFLDNTKHNKNLETILHMSFSEISRMWCESVISSTLCAIEQVILPSMAWGKQVENLCYKNSWLRVLPRFFDQVRQETTYASSGNKYLFNDLCCRQTRDSNKWVAICNYIPQTLVALIHIAKWLVLYLEGPKYSIV